VRINARGLPHSEIPGSKPVCGLPELIAAYHVLHRHLAPRHSPYALSSLTIDIRIYVVLPDVLHTIQRRKSVSAHCCAFCGRKKLPFAGYSVVKELFLIRGNIAPRKPSVASGRFPRTPWLAHSRGPKPHSVRSPELTILRLQFGRLQGQPLKPLARLGPRAPAEREGRRPHKTIVASWGFQGPQRAVRPEASQN
jgi:hypothetical protein